MGFFSEMKKLTRPYDDDDDEFEDFTPKATEKIPVQPRPAAAQTHTPQSRTSYEPARRGDNNVVNIHATTQLQVVAAIRYITNGTYLSIIKEMLESEVSDDLKPLKERVAKLVDLYEAAINKVKEANDQAVHDFLARRLYNMTGDIVMSLLILDDATKAPEMFQKSANVYVRMAEEEVLGHSAYIQNFKAEDLESFKA